MRATYVAERHDARDRVAPLAAPLHQHALELPLLSFIDAAFLVVIGELSKQHRQDPQPTHIIGGGGGGGGGQGVHSRWPSNTDPLQGMGGGGGGGGD